MANSTKAHHKNKPQKPYPGFPLFPHSTGRWAKKIRQKLHYFGYWNKSNDSGWLTALNLYQEQREDLHAGRTPRVAGDGLTVRALCNRFLTAKKQLLDIGEITDRTFADYYRSCKRIVSTFGKRRIIEDLAADDFGQLRAELAKTLGPVALGNEIGRVRVVFKFAYDQSLIDKPLRYGQSFFKPSKKTLRKARQANGKRMYESDELRRIIAAAPQQLKAMIVRGINCGLGQSDCANIPQSALNLESGWLDYPRPKTGIERRCPLWPVTVKVLQQVIPKRPRPNNEADANLLFLTKYGNRWVRSSGHDDPGKRAAIDSVAQEFAKLLRKLDINGRRNFYALRHTFQTIGGEAKDPDAVSSIMGHADSSMASLYRERISDERLQAVTNTVHAWLFGS